MKTKQQKIQKANVAIAREISVNVIIGMPGNGCLYHGICRIEEDDLHSKNGHSLPNRIKARINEQEEGQLLFKFIKKTISEDQKKERFESGFFIVLKKYKIPEFVCKALGKPNRNIYQGIYPVVENEAFYEVVFPQ